MTGQDQQNLVLESWSRTVQKQRAQRLLIGLKIIDACGPINPLQQNKQHGEARAALVELERTRDDAIISASPEDLPGVLVHCKTARRIASIKLCVSCAAPITLISLCNRVVVTPCARAQTVCLRTASMPKNYEAKVQRLKTKQTYNCFSDQK